MSDELGPRVCIFVGPSLSSTEARAAFSHVNAEITVLPPIEQGDILRLVEDLPDVIAIADGHFFHAPAVLHREILLALELGARVLGAASIGALRAAELDVFGMEGIGEIYRLYRAGTIDADDEVAVLHSTAGDGFQPLSEALVSIRHNLRRARRRRVISPRTAAGLLTTMSRLHFTRRTYEALLAAVPAEERSALAWFLEREAVDLKRQDAQLLVRTIADRIAGSATWPRKVGIPVNQTSLFHQYRREYVGRRIDGRHIPNDLVLAFERLLSPSFPSLYRQVSLRCLALDEAGQRGLIPEDATRLVARFREARGLGSDAELETWLRGRWLSRGELVDALRERDLEDQLLALYQRRHPASGGRAALLERIASDVATRAGVPKSLLTRPLLIYPGVPCSAQLMTELKLRDAFTSAVGVASRILQNNSAIFERHPWLDGAPVRRGLLTGLFATRWGVASDQLESAILARGFTGYGDFVEAARHVFVYERTSIGAYRPERLADCFHVEPE